MNTERGMIFKNTTIWFFFALFPVMGVGVYIFFKDPLPGILLFLTGFIVPVLAILFCPLNLTISRLGISKKSILRSWNFGWNDITGWNVVYVLNKSRSRPTIWFRTGANIYKISPDLLKDGDIEYLKAYFERDCGQQTEGDSRLSFTLF